jgi:alpha-L-rhamnosidase
MSERPVKITRLRFEHLVEPLGIGTPRPRLSWATETERQGWRQAAYQVEVERDAGPAVASVWVEDGDSVLRPWPFPPLASRERATVRVRVRDTEGETSRWSEGSTVEAGLLSPGDWSAEMITLAWDEDRSTSPPAPLLRRAFTLREGITRARLYVTAWGVYEIHLNGTTVGADVLQPGWTSYHHRLRYATHDVTDLVRPGDNAVGAMLGDGWFRGNLPGGVRNFYGDRLGLLLQIEVTHRDGQVERVGTDTRWRGALGAVLASDLYDGETYDARRERDGWDRPAFDGADWSPAEVAGFDPAVLVAPTAPPARRVELVRPVAVTASPSGATLVDFGQNLVGRVRLTVSAERGTTITLRHAEVLEDGELAIRPLRAAKATDRYILRGGGPEVWEPRFTFHGFRYAEIVGWPGELDPGDVVAVVCASDLERAGWFECSDPLVERLHENVVWSLRGNTVEIPTDCPQRDERLGWTGDIQVFAPTAAFLSDVGGFLESWLADLAAEQADHRGVVPFVVPNPLSTVLPAAAWGDASVMVPWVLYQRLGDRGLLERQFASMRAWVEAVAAETGSSGLWDRGFQFGDWLDPAAPPEKPGAARTDRHLVATAYLARSAQLVAEVAEVLGDTGAVARYRALAERTREAFAREYVSPAGRVVSDAATGYVLALCFDLLPDRSQRQHAGARLVELVEEAGYRIATGFVGTPLICDALTRAGHLDVAYRLLLERGCPSWLYPVTMGATTIWERWDSMLPDGSVNPGEMTSFNHYALGAVADWLHRTVAGLGPAAPGYRRISFQPRPGGGLTRAAARHRTPYGVAAVSWVLRDGTLMVEATVPPNTEATVHLPGRAPFEIGSGDHSWTVPFTAGGDPPLG